ncbi:hypothetical protein CTAYLR_006588 [Chrysophaeum taylorii]|uniref:FH2 domain-containing protein n=1 Tax=Chrysophaeum taylorii TaxID=2483200 RepID=A0AAD7XPR4_9STRA|nr:hypothetical protein CTAYLR_006588 [Chrysophaeum taylorii]
MPTTRGRRWSPVEGKIDWTCELYVYKHFGWVARELLKILGGKWVSVRASFQGPRIYLQSTGKEKYEKTIHITRKTSIEAAPQPGRFVVAINGFNGTLKTRRLLDCKTQEQLDQVKKHVNEAIALGNDKPAIVSSGRHMKDNRPHAYTSPVVLEQDNEEAEDIRPQEWRVSEVGATNLHRVMAQVTKEVADARRRRRGYTAHELAQLNSELLELEKQSKKTLKFKVRRILRLMAKEGKDARNSVSTIDERGSMIGGRAFRAFSQHARQHGMTLGASSSHHDSQNLANSSIVETLPSLLEKNRVLPTLVTTLHYLSRKEKLTLHDAVTCLFTGTVIKTLLNITGGLSILLSLPRERHAFRKLCVSALQCRVPVFTIRILELLAALVLLPDNVEGYRMARSVLREVDKNASWGHCLCASTPLTPTAEARSNEQPPPFSALAQLLIDGTNELRVAVMSLFTALCNSLHQNQGRESALWLQVQIFHAIRVVVPIRTRESESGSQGPRKRRASSSALRRAGAPGMTVADSKEDDTSEAASIDDSEEKQGTLCQPLIDLLDECETSPSDSSKLLKHTLERFLDSWDARELDEAEDCENEIVGSAMRVEILASRIRRAALLLAHADVDGMLDVLGHELELASAKPICRDGGDDIPLSLDVHSTVTALYRLQSKDGNRGAAPRPAGVGPLKGITGTKNALNDMLRKTRPSFPSAPDDKKAAAAAPAAAAGPVALKDDPTYAKFFKMIRMHVPKTAVALKMSAEGLDPAILDMNVNEPAPEAKPATKMMEERALEDDPTYAKYFKMLRMHVPKEAVINKMTTDGLDPSVLALDPDGPVPSTSTKPKKPPPPLARGPPLEDDPKYAKFFKMLKLHVPKMAVAAKMAAENLDAAVLDLDPEKPMPVDRVAGGAGAAAAAKSLDVAEKPAGPPVYCAHAPTAKVRKVFLDLITDGSGTWWVPDGEDESAKRKKKQQQQQQQHRREDVVVLEDGALKDLESVFLVPPRRGKLANEDAKAAAVAAVSDMQQSELEALTKKKKKKEMRSPVTEACGGKRSFELSVLFPGLKIPTPELAGALALLDPDAKLAANPTSLSILYDMLLRKLQREEVEKLSRLVSRHPANEDVLLDDVSLFFAQLLRVVRRPREKVVFLWFRTTLEDRFNELAAHVEAFERAAVSVRDSEALKKLLRFTLAISNFLNFGTARANVPGIKISSLLKLRETKTTKTDNYKNLLAYTAKHAGVEPKDLRAELPEDLLSAVYLSPPRSDLKRLIVELKTECDQAAREQHALSEDADRADLAADAMHAAAARADDFATKAKDALTRLDKLYVAMEETVDKTLALYGEPPTIDAEDWVKDIDRFCAQYETEHKELTDAIARKRKREALEKKRALRESECQAMHKSHLHDDAKKVTARGQVNRIMTDIASGAALESQGGGMSMKDHADSWAKKLRAHHKSHDDDDADDDEFDFED